MSTEPVSIDVLHTRIRSAILGDGERLSPAWAVGVCQRMLAVVVTFMDVYRKRPASEWFLLSSWPELAAFSRVMGANYLRQRQTPLDASGFVKLAARDDPHWRQVVSQMLAVHLHDAAREAAEGDYFDKANELCLIGYIPASWQGARPWAEVPLAKLWVMIELAVNYFTDPAAVLDVMVRKYFHLGDKWCKTIPCTCPLVRVRDVPDPERDGVQDVWGPSQWQEYVYRAFAHTNARHGVHYTMTRLITEFDELNAEATPANGPMSVGRSASELADLRIWTLVLANAVGVDLEHAVNALLDDPAAIRSCLL